MPGGQYTNLKQQAQALGLIHRWEEIKDMYHRVSMMFGDLIKVTPSSKVVGDMALFMVQNDLTEEDVYAKGDILDFPASVVEFFEGTHRHSVPRVSRKAAEAGAQRTRTYQRASWRCTASGRF